MSRYEYVHIGTPSQRSGHPWTERVPNIDGEIVETVKREETTIGLIVEVRSVNNRST